MTQPAMDRPSASTDTVLRNGYIAAPLPNRHSAANVSSQDFGFFLGSAAHSPSRLPYRLQLYGSEGRAGDSRSLPLSKKRNCASHGLNMWAFFRSVRLQSSAASRRPAHSRSRRVPRHADVVRRVSLRAPPQLRLALSLDPGKVPLPPRGNPIGHAKRLRDVRCVRHCRPAQTMRLFARYGSMAL